MAPANPIARSLRLTAGPYQSQSVSIRHQPGTARPTHSVTESTAPRTRLFARCRGVFQGGGARGAAHVGAYEAARESGIELIEVAGASAGAIIAALVGAGATPSYLREHVSGLRFSDLLSKPEGVFKQHWSLRSVLYRIAIRCLLPYLTNGVVRGKQHSSRGIEQWVDDRLTELLPNVDGRVRFSDLRLPTWILASDLSAERPKIWSREATPDAVVSFAVRCSCSIPLFFEPVSVGPSLYVDGGLLSNVPTFVFSQKDQPHSPPGAPILAFCLTNDSPTIPDWSLLSFLKRLLDTALRGSADIQSSLQSGVSVVAIPTHGVTSTDFNLDNSQVQTLLDSGHRATHQFVADEARHFRRATGNRFDLANEEQLHDTIVREARDPGDEFLVVCRNTKWYWRLFLTVASWRMAGSNVRIIVPPIVEFTPPALEEKQRRDNLRGLGVAVHESTSIEHELFILGHGDRERGVAIVLKPAHSDLGPFATAYLGSTHMAAIVALGKPFELSQAPDVVAPLELVTAAAEPIIERLRSGVWQYNSDEVTITLERIPVREVQLTVRRVRPHKLAQIAILRKSYEHSGLPLFGAAAFRCEGGDTSPVTPPVVELWGKQPVVIQGNSRFLHALRRDLEELTVLVVRNVHAPPPGVPIPISQVALAGSNDSRTDRIDEFDYDAFRHIERAARPV